MLRRADPYAEHSRVTISQASAGQSLHSSRETREAHAKLAEDWKFYSRSWKVTATCKKEA